MKATITKEQALLAAAIIKEYAAAQNGCGDCIFARPGSERCLVSPSGCACAWNLPAISEKGVPLSDTFQTGDVCTYSFGNKNKSVATVEIVRVLDDPRGAVEIKFLEVLIDDTGNGLFKYLHRTGKTMNASIQYLKKKEA